MDRHTEHMYPISIVFLWQKHLQVLYINHLLYGGRDVSYRRFYDLILTMRGNQHLRVLEVVQNPGSANQSQRLSAYAKQYQRE